jgi:hypothetical protein
MAQEGAMLESKELPEGEIVLSCGHDMNDGDGAVAIEVPVSMQTEILDSGLQVRYILICHECSDDEDIDRVSERLRPAQIATAMLALFPDGAGAN